MRGEAAKFSHTLTLPQMKEKEKCPRKPKQKRPFRTSFWRKPEWERVDRLEEKEQQWMKVECLEWKMILRLLNSVLVKS